MLIGSIVKENRSTPYFEILSTKKENRLSILNTAYPLPADTKPVEAGDEKTSQPFWLSCGLSIKSTCGCDTEMYPSSLCPECHIPVTVGETEETETTRAYKPAQRDESKKIGFKPGTVFSHLENFGCTDEQLSFRATKYVEKDLARHAADMLFKSAKVADTVGNVSIPMLAHDITGGDPVTPGMGLNSLHLNDCITSSDMIVIPWQALSWFIENNKVQVTPDGLYDNWGCRVVTDCNILGEIGPAETPLDLDNCPEGTIKFEDYTTKADISKGEMWIYKTGPIFVGTSEPKTRGTSPTGDSLDVSLNHQSVVAEAQVMPVFDVCDIQAIKVVLNEAVCK